MHPPGERPAEPPEDVVPLDPAPARERPGLLLQDAALGAAVHTDAQGEGGEEAEEAGGHLRHDGTENLGGRVLALPRHVHTQHEHHVVGAGGKLRSGNQLRVVIA